MPKVDDVYRNHAVGCSEEYEHPGSCRDAAAWAQWKAEALNCVAELRRMALGDEEIFDALQDTTLLTERQGEFLAEQLGLA